MQMCYYTKKVLGYHLVKRLDTKSLVKVITDYMKAPANKMEIHKNQLVSVMKLSVKLNHDYKNAAQVCKRGG